MGLANEFDCWVAETGRATRIENAWVNLLSTDEDKDPDMMQDDSRHVERAYTEGYSLEDAFSFPGGFEPSFAQYRVFLGAPLGDTVCRI